MEFLCSDMVRDAMNAADASVVDQPGHILNVVVRSMSGSIIVDGKDPITFLESATAINVRNSTSFLLTCTFPWGLQPNNLPSGLVHLPVPAAPYMRT